MLTALSIAALGQTMTVLEDQGQDVDPAGTTLVKFTSARPVGIHRVLSSSTGMGSGWYGTTSMYAETTERLCASPCTVEVPNGHYAMRASDNFLFGRRFDLQATGEPVVYTVRDARPATGMAGILLTGVGLGGLIGGGMLWALDPEEGSGRPLTLVSAPVSAVGIGLLVDAFARARQQR